MFCGQEIILKVNTTIDNKSKYKKIIYKFIKKKKLLFLIFPLLQKRPNLSHDKYQYLEDFLQHNDEAKFKKLLKIIKLTN